MSHYPHQLGPRALCERLGEGVLVGRGTHADLDQLVVAQRGVDRADHAGARSVLAHLNERLQRVRLRAQEAALEALQSVRLFIAHAAHSKCSKGWRSAGVALLGAAFAAACASTPPPAPAAAFAPVPRATAIPTAHPPVSFPAAIADTASAPLLDQAPPENTSLTFTRAVLDRRGTRLDAVQREGVARALVRAEAEHGISVLMTLSLIAQESRFDPRAKGPTGSLGLMQLQPATAAEVARRNGLAWQSNLTLLDPVQNVRIALAYLAELRARFGSTDHAMAAYNIGPRNLQRLLRTRPLRHGPYLKKVHGHADAIRSEFGEPELAIGG